jgi:hypothetical protein
VRSDVVHIKLCVPLFGEFALASRLGSGDYARPQKFGEKLEGRLKREARDIVNDSTNAQSGSWRGCLNLGPGGLGEDRLRAQP